MTALHWPGARTLLILQLAACGSAQHPEPQEPAAELEPLSAPDPQPRGPVGCMVVDGQATCFDSGDPARDARMRNLFIQQLLAEEHYEQAIPLAVETVELSRAAYGAKHRNVAADLLNVGILYRKIGDDANAEANIRAAIAVDTEVFGGAAHPEVAMDQLYLASVLCRRVEPAQCKQLYAAPLTVLEHESEAKYRVAFATGQRNFGDWLLAQKAYKDAYVAVKHAYDALAEVGSEDLPSVCADLVHLAQIVGDRKGADEWIACAEGGPASAGAP